MKNLEPELPLHARLKISLFLERKNNMAVKDQVLQVLTSTQNLQGFVSGEELAQRCGVTRASVWKAVESLRSRGLKIEAVTNRGYRLLENNTFSAEGISAFLADKSANIVFFETIDSTNTESKRRLAVTEARKLHKTCVVAAEQTDGRGRLGRKFVSPQKSGIYLSIIYSCRTVANPAVYTASTAVGVCRSIEKLFGTETKIKWVNDIFLQGKKVVGILTEGVTDFETGMIEAAIIGIGINILNNPLLPQDVAGGLLSENEDSAAKRNELAASVITEVCAILDGGEKSVKEAMKEYRNRSLLLGRTVEVSPVIGQTENNFICTVKDVTDDAGLLVVMPDGTEKVLQCGEVSIHSEKMCYNE